MEIVSEFPRPVREIEHMLIPMSDGAALAARIWLPADAEHDPVPAVLEYIPYRKRDLTAERDLQHLPYVAGHGYACVRVDLRGSGESDGVLTDEYLQQELDDGVEVLRWIASQPWCTGAIGMIGISWGGFNGLQIAAMQPPQLKAVITLCSTDDRYADDVHYMGGCLLGDNLSWASTMFDQNTHPPDPLLVGERWRSIWLERLEKSGLWLETWMRHPHRDEYWKHGSVCEDYSAIRCPVMAVSGWADGYTNAVFRLMEHLEVPRKGLVGPWSHKYPHLGEPGPAIGFLQEELRWWNRWLKGHDNGIMSEPMIRVWMQDSVPPTTSYKHRPGRWVAEWEWPSPRIEHRRYALGKGTLVLNAESGGEPRREPSREPPAASGGQPELELQIQSPLSVGLFAGKWCSYQAPPDLPHDQREEDGGALVFESRMLEKGIQILGQPVVELELSANEPVAMVAVRLSDVAPDDKATRVTYGLLNLTHRDGHERPSALDVGRRYRVRVPMNHIAQDFPPGHRFRLSISTSYWPLAWPSPRPARLHLYPESSVLDLPVRPSRREDEALRAFDPPVGAPPVRKTLLVSGKESWTVIRDLAREESRLEVVHDSGSFRLDDIDLVIHGKVTEVYSNFVDEYDSLSGETVWERSFSRGEWQVRTVTRTLLTSDSETFRIRADLDAYEGKSRVFSKSWDTTIERNLV